MEHSKLLGHPSLLSALSHWNNCLFCRASGRQPKGSVRLRTSVNDGAGGNVRPFSILALNMPLLQLLGVFVKYVHTKKKNKLYWCRLYYNKTTIQLLVDDEQEHYIHPFWLSEMRCTQFSYG